MKNSLELLNSIWNIWSYNNKSNILFCSCGNRNGHSLDRCGYCGQKYDISGNELCFHKFITMRANRPGNNIEESIKYNYRHCQFKLNGETIEDFKKAYYSIINY